MKEFKNVKVLIEVNKDKNLINSLLYEVSYKETNDSYVLTGFLTSIAIIVNINS